MDAKEMLGNSNDTYHNLSRVSQVGFPFTLDKDYLAFFKDIALRTKLAFEVSLESPYCTCTRFGMAKNIADVFGIYHRSESRKVV